MGFRFFRRVNLAKGVTLNLSKSGGSMSVGPRGIRFTMGPQGARVTLGIPGTGLYYTTNFSLGKLWRLFGQSSESPQEQATPHTSETAEIFAPVEAPTPSQSPPRMETPEMTKTPSLRVRQKDQLTKDDFDRLDIPDEQRALTAGCKELAGGNEDAAFSYLQQAAHLADGAFLAGFLALKKDRLEEAIKYLTAAAGKEQKLGHYLSNYGIGATMNLPVTEEVTAHVGPDIRGVLLALAEAYQAQERQPDATACLERLRQLEPNDVVVKLSLAELLMEGEVGNKEIYQKVMQLTEGVENESAVHTALLLYKAQALRALGLLDAALEVLTGALRRQKDRPDELLQALRYERALVYEALGKKKKARTELEKLYAENPNYEDVAARLNM